MTACPPTKSLLEVELLEFELDKRMLLLIAANTFLTLVPCPLIGAILIAANGMGFGHLLTIILVLFLIWYWQGVIEIRQAKEFSRKMQLTTSYVIPLFVIEALVFFFYASAGLNPLQFLPVQMPADSVIALYPDKPGWELSQLTPKDQSKIDLATRLRKVCGSMPDSFEKQSLAEKPPMHKSYGQMGCDGNDYPIGRALFVDFYPAGLNVTPPAGHESSFSLFHSGGRALPFFASGLESDWSKWRARIEYCLRAKWNSSEIKNDNYCGEFVARVKKDGNVRVLTYGLTGLETNVDPITLIEDMSGDAILKFPKGSRAEFVELYIEFSDLKKENPKWGTMKY